MSVGDSVTENWSGIFILYGDLVGGYPWREN